MTAPAKPPSLTPTSYLVLGLVARQGECTSYDMKRTVSGSIGYFWTFPHSQLYAEPAGSRSWGCSPKSRRRRAASDGPIG